MECIEFSMFAKICVSVEYSTIALWNQFDLVTLLYSQFISTGFMLFAETVCEVMRRSAEEGKMGR